MRQRVLLTDGALALAVLAVGIAVTAPLGPRADEIVASVLLCAPLTVRRTAPVPSFAAVLIAAAVSLVVTDRVIAGDPAVLVGLFTFVAHAPGERGLRLVGTAVALLGAVPAGVRWAGPGDGWAMAGAVGIAFVHLLLAGAFGELRRQALRRSADRLREAAAAERVRIARELHDVVAHALAVVVVQADAGRYAAASDAAAAERTLRTIGETAREALTDMRAALGALRDAGTVAPGEPGAGASHRGGATVVGDVQALVDRLAAAGLVATLTVEGEVRALPAAVAHAVHRIAQESLTNVVKHGGEGARAVVTVAFAAGEVRVTITDDGRGAGTGDGAGSGLAGMRERVEITGGTLDAGPAPGGGWRVHARLPA